MSPADLDALARAVAPLVVAQLANALGLSQAPYSTRRGFEPPEFTARAKKWRSVAPTIPGSARIGRWVSVPRDAYASWVAAQSKNEASAVPATNVEPWSPRAALASAGLRGTR